MEQLIIFSLALFSTLVQKLNDIFTVKKIHFEILRVNKDGYTE